jgi:geranylgeranyl diphosphate/geranylgeranyl-bacteriochlorophyllide a reductase
VTGPLHDAAVIGAGPAGAWTACVLARRGARVLLLDPSHPREKPCGGGITARALALVANVVDLQALPSIPIRSARFAASSTPAVADVSLDEQALLVASRTEFDGLVVDAARRAGAVVLATRVTKVRSAGDGFEIDTAAGPRRAAVIVGADGANSLVRRTLASPFRRDQLSLATGFFAHGVTSRDIVIEFVSDPPGYIWSFPRPTHLAIGMCTQADRSSNATGLRHATAAWIGRTGIGAGARLERYSWPIPSLPAADFATLTSSGPGWYLVGDAAGLVDPITREGIYFALLSAQWAADAILSGTADAPQHYARRVREDIGEDLGRAARVKELFFRPRFTRLLIDALQHSAGIRTVMADLVAGQQDYAGLKWRLVKTLRPGLAARLMTLSLAPTFTAETAQPAEIEDLKRA